MRGSLNISHVPLPLECCHFLSGSIGLCCLYFSPFVSLCPGIATVNNPMPCEGMPHLYDLFHWVRSPIPFLSPRESGYRIAIWWDAVLSQNLIAPFRIYHGALPWKGLGQTHMLQFWEWAPEWAIIFGPPSCISRPSSMCLPTRWMPNLTIQWNLLLW
jgi:hypothetical protein